MRPETGAPTARYRPSVPRGPRLFWALRLLVLGAVFALGVALGEALHDNPAPGGGQRLLRTLTPATVTPRSETVTVTVHGP